MAVTRNDPAHPSRSKGERGGRLQRTAGERIVMGVETTAAERQKAALLEVGRITSAAVRREREMWLRFARQVREITEGRVVSWPTVTYCDARPPADTASRA